MDLFLAHEHVPFPTHSDSAYLPYFGKHLFPYLKFHLKLLRLGSDAVLDMSRIDFNELSSVEVRRRLFEQFSVSVIDLSGPSPPPSSLPPRSPPLGVKEISQSKSRSTATE